MVEQSINENAELVSIVPLTPEQRLYRKEAARAAIQLLGGLSTVANRFGRSVESVRRWRLNGIPRDHIPQVCIALEEHADEMCIRAEQLVGLSPLTQCFQQPLTSQEATTNAKR